MSDLMRDLTAIATAVIGVALLTVLVKQGNNTSGVIQASTTGFANVLNAAMGNGLAG